MEKFRVGASLSMLCIMPDPDMVIFNLEWTEVHKRAIAMNDVKCVETDGGVEEDAKLMTTIKINTMEDTCSHKDSGECNETIREWFDLRHFRLHSKAGQLMYQGRNVPFLEEIKAEGPKKMDFQLHGTHVMVME